MAGVRVIARIFVFSLATATAVIAGADPASAHSGLKGSTPAANSTVAVAPTVFELTFGAPVEAGLSDVKVIDASGNRAESGKPTKSTSKNVLKVGMKPTSNGLYRVDWKAGSSDGHPISGTLSFTVDDPGLVVAAGSPDTQSADTNKAEPVATTHANHPDTSLAAQSTGSGGSTFPATQIAIAMLLMSLVLFAIRSRI